MDSLYVRFRKMFALVDSLLVAVSILGCKSDEDVITELKEAGVMVHGRPDPGYQVMYTRLRNKNPVRTCITVSNEKGRHFYQKWRPVLYSSWQLVATA